jgi:LmbE family N-acetylglucosaminyl deacetylase
MGLVLKLHHSRAEVFVPDGQPQDAALARITHLGIGAHQDDLEFMAFHGIAACHGSKSEWFGGVTCTNGAGSSRTGRYAQFSDEQMMDKRREEQRRAATAGRYGIMVQLDHPSADAKRADCAALCEDLVSILAATSPKVVYTHNLADKHDTHVAVAMHVVRAIRALPPAGRPAAVYGCEVWRDLDWMLDREKVVHDLAGSEDLAAKVGSEFDSQIAGGKRYDLAVLGRRRANATFFESHEVDQSDAISFAMDLTPLAHDDSLEVAEYVAGFIDRFRADVIGRIARYEGR